MRFTVNGLIPELAPQPGRGRRSRHFWLDNRGRVQCFNLFSDSLSVQAVEYRQPVEDVIPFQIKGQADPVTHSSEFVRTRLDFFASLVYFLHLCFGQIFPAFGDELGFENHNLVMRIGTLTAYGICLLYTSPSPRDLSTSRMPSSA